MQQCFNNGKRCLPLAHPQHDPAPAELCWCLTSTVDGRSGPSELGLLLVPAQRTNPGAGVPYGMVVIAQVLRQSAAHAKTAPSVAL